jgi:hypothetical protein
VASTSQKVIEGGHVPVNGKAAKVLRRGITFEVSKYMPGQVADQTVAPPMRHLEDIPSHLHPLIGFSYARMTVIGLCVDSTHDGKGMWVVRCQCGMFAIRQLSTIANLDNRHDCCARCRADLRIRRDELGRRLRRRVQVGELPGACPPRGPLPAGVILSPKKRSKLRAKEKQRRNKEEQRRKELEAVRQMDALRRQRSFPVAEPTSSMMEMAFAVAKKQR